MQKNHNGFIAAVGVFTNSMRDIKTVWSPLNLNIKLQD